MALRARTPEESDEYEDEVPAEEDEVEDEIEASGRRVPVLAVVSLGLIAVFGALIGWLWVSFDESDMAALAPPAVRSEMPPPPVAAAARTAAPAQPVIADAAAEVPASEASVESAAAAAEVAADAVEVPQTEATELAARAPEAEQESAEPAVSEPPSEQAPPPVEPAAEVEAPAEAEPQVPAESVPPAQEQDVAMAPAPDPELLAPSANGPLPVIGPDGRQAWQAYGRDFADPEGRPRIAILLGPLGLIESASYSAIQQLPANVTLAFAPYTRNLSEWIAQARASGHEVILHIPMEPFDYPQSDPGPHTLLTSISASDNIQRLEWLLGRASGYIGVSNFMGDRFTSSADHVRPVLDVLKSRGLMFLDAQASRNSVAARVALDLGVPRALNNRFIDSEASRIAIDARLFELERIATSVGTAVGIGFPYPVTIERIAAWAQGLDGKGLVLAPLSAVANRQNIQ